MGSVVNAFAFAPKYMAEGPRKKEQEEEEEDEEGEDEDKDEEDRKQKEEEEEEDEAQGGMSTCEPHRILISDRRERAQQRPYCLLGAHFGFVCGGDEDAM